MKIISEHIGQIENLCDQHRVRSLFAFGSVTNDRFKADSDIDFVIDIDASDPLEYTDHYLNYSFN